MQDITKEMQDAYFAKIFKMSGIKKELPFPNAKPLYGNSGEQLANRKAAHEHAKKVLDWNRKRLAIEGN